MRWRDDRFVLPTLAVLALGLCACGGPPTDQAEDEEAREAVTRDWGPPVPGGQMVARYLGDPKFLSPLIEESVADSAINYQVYPYLAGEQWADCQVENVPQLAESWEWTDGPEGQPGGTTLTYHLRKGLTWADGVPLTAEDVVFSYGRYSDPAVASPRFAYTEKIASVTAPDPLTVVFSFTEYYPPDLQMDHTTLGVVPKHRLEDVPPGEFRSHPLNRKPLSAGPYRVTRFDAGSEIVLERCTDCDLKPQAFLDRVVIRIIPEETTALVALKRGSIDFMELSTYEPVQDIRANHPDIRIYRRGWRFMDYIGWNSKDPDAIKQARAELGEGELIDLDDIPPHPLFGDREVRRALTMAIDRDSIIEALTNVAGESYGRPATGTITPELCRDYADIDPLPYDPDRAREVLASRGWRDSDGDTVLDKDGRPFRFVLNYNSGNQRRYDACIYVQSMLAQIGVTVEVEPIESSVFFSNLRNKDYHAAMAGWSAATFVDPATLWHSGSEYVFNFTSYKDERVDEICEKGPLVADPDERRALWRELQRRVYDDQPYTFLYWMDRVVLAHERFQNVQSNILTVYHDLHEWWVPEELRRYQKRAELER